MEKRILLVTSDIKSTKKLEDKNYVSFHKRMSLCFNRTTLENIGIHHGMYACFTNVDFANRKIHIEVLDEKPNKNSFECLSHPNSKWYKITNPQVDNRNKYCYIRTTSLIYDNGLACLGCFNYEHFIFGRNNKVIHNIIIKF